MTPAKRAGLIFVFLWFFIGGSGHFIEPQFFQQIVPPWVPYPLETVYVSGLFELLGAFALFVPRLRPLAGIALFALIICVTPANIYMLQNAGHFPWVPVWALWLRLPIQVALLACVWWSTRPALPQSPSGNSPSR
jgi:uncharacterized membrane protein